MESISLLSGPSFRAVIRRPACTMSPRERLKGRKGKMEWRGKSRRLVMERVERKRIPDIDGDEYPCV